MKVDIDNIGPAGLTFEEDLSAAWLSDALAGAHGFSAVAGGSFVARLQRRDATIHAQGKIAVSLRGVCARCLQACDLTVAAPIDVSLVPTAALSHAQDDGEVAEADIDLGTYDDHCVDTDALAREALLLELPMRSLCRSDCAGLCASCGADRNAASCACQPPIDPRLRALARLRLS